MPKLQLHIELVSLIERYGNTRLQRVARHHRDGDEYAGPCPFCGGTDRFHVWPEAERPHYNCVRGCNRNGDAIQFLVDHEGMTFVEACHELDIDVEEAIEVRKYPHSTHDAPPAAWQERAKEFSEYCRQYLLKKAPTALAWLHDRGLTDETIWLAELGYCPALYTDELENWGLSSLDTTKDKIRIPEGITLPWYHGGDLWKLAVRRLNPAEDQKKYGQVVGSSEGLYGADKVESGKPVMIVEGEFDALSVQQVAGDLVLCVATGSTTRGYTPRWVQLLQQCPTILQSFDSDAEGDEWAHRWLHTFPQAMRWQPWQHDTNDMLTKGEDIRGWVQIGLHIATKPMPVAPAGENDLFDSLSIECIVCRAEVEHYDEKGTPFCAQHYPLQGPIQPMLIELAQKSREVLEPIEELLLSKTEQFWNTLHKNLDKQGWYERFKRDEQDLLARYGKR